MDYHSKLRQFFENKGISQKEAGDKMGYSKMMMSKYFTKSGPNMEFLMALVREFPDIDLNYLFKDGAKVNPGVYEPSPPVYAVSHDIIEEIEAKLKELKSNLTPK